MTNSPFPWDLHPDHVIRDRDRVFGSVVIQRGTALQWALRDKANRARASPWQNGFLSLVTDRVDSPGNACDHIIVVGEGHLRRVLRAYASYYNGVRTHRSLNKDAPVHRPTQRIGILAVPSLILGGLHHQYVRIRFSVHTATIDYRSEQFDSRAQNAAISDNCGCQPVRMGDVTLSWAYVLINTRTCRYNTELPAFHSRASGVHKKMDEEQPSLGQSVRAARIAKGYSQAKLAKLVGAKQQTIGKIEKGKITQGPTVYELVALLNLPGSALPGYLRGTSHTIPFYSAFEYGGRTLRQQEQQNRFPISEAIVGSGYAMSCPDDCLQPRAKYGDILLVNDLGPLREGSLYVFYPTSDDALRSNPIPTMLLVETGRFVGREGADRIIVEKSDPDERLIWRESDYKAHEIVGVLFRGGPRP